MITANIKIITSTGREIDYITPESLNIKLNRISEDLQDISARFGEYSYTFSLPKTSNNVEIFGYAGVKYIKNNFAANPIEVKVFNNDALLLDGQIELTSITDTTFECVFYSKFTQLIDLLKDKNMQDISVCPKIEWNYEDTIRTHINANYADSDEADYQFPFVFYNTVFCPTSVFSGLTDTIVDSNGTTNHAFQRDRDWQNWYYIINHSSIGENEFYFHQFPLAFYLKTMVRYLFEDIGWTVGGSFWEDENIKKIIVPYVGDTDVYDRACYCSNGVSITGSSCGAGTLMLDTAKFMPDYKCDEFLSDVINIFNLYFTIDVENKVINFETYDVMFTNKIAPYDITNKLFESTVNVSKVNNYNPSISWEMGENQRILGDNRYIASSGYTAYQANYLITANNTLFNQVHNYIGTTSGEIKIGFQAPTVKRMRIRNEFNFSDVDKNAGDSVIFVPFVSNQLPEDNQGKSFSKKDTDTIVYNDESSIQYKGKPALFYYYGISNSDFQQKTVPIGAQSEYFYVNFDDVNQKLPICSPFALNAYRDIINQTLENAGNDVNAMLASYMQSIYLMLGTYTGVTNTTDYSLVFANIPDYGDTLYTKFYLNRFKRYQESEILTADMMMNDNDWREMSINTPIKYNQQLYSIVSITDYDVVRHQAKITLIKML